MAVERSCQEWEEKKALMQGAAAFFAGIPDVNSTENAPLQCYLQACSLLERQGVERSCTQKGFLRSNALKETDARKKMVFQNQNYFWGDIQGQDAFARGYRSAMATLFQLLPIPKRKQSKEARVALLGGSPAYAGDLVRIVRLRELLRQKSIVVKAVPGMGSSLEEIAESVQVSLNVVVHKELGAPMARYLQREYGIPWLLLPLFTSEAQQIQSIEKALEKPQRQCNSADREDSPAALSPVVFYIGSCQKENDCEAHNLQQ